MKGNTDLVIASDVIYLTECLVPLMEQTAWFLKEKGGKCLMVNNRIRTDKFGSKINEAIDKAGMRIVFEEDIVNESFDMKFWLFVLEMKE